MADLLRIKREIARIASRPNAVGFKEITWIADQLKMNGYTVNYRKATHAWVFRIGGETFNVSDHNRGSAHIKSVYVAKFLGAMINLELYEE